MLTTNKTMLFCIGAQKAGTSWLYMNLSVHPECYMPVKEVNYFDTAGNPKRAERVLKRHNGYLESALERNSSKLDRKNIQKRLKTKRAHLDLLEQFASFRGDDSDYLYFLTKGSDGKPLVGDITPNYSPLTRAEFARMAQLSPNSRFLFLMRDPVDRLWSATRMSAELREKNLIGEKGVSSDDVFLKRCLKRLDATTKGEVLRDPSMSNYKLTMQELEAAVPQGQIMTMFFEDLFEQSSFDKICDFLGIAPVPAQTETVKFPGRKLSLPADRYADVYKWLSEQYDWAAERYGDKLPKRWRDQMQLGQAPATAETK